MFELRVSNRRKGISDVFVRDTCPPVRVGVVCTVVPKSVWTADWIFIPARWFAQRFPVSCATRRLIGHSRYAAVNAYLQEVSGNG